MKKKILQENDLKGSIKIATTEKSTIYQLKNGRIFKQYNPYVIEDQKLFDVDIESKILSAQPLKQSPEIIVPEMAVYTPNGQFCGYIMQRANGIDLNTYDDCLTTKQRSDLKKYAEIHYKLESVLRRNPDIVFPDFCTCDNIFIDSKGNIQFIDYDGLQIGSHKSYSVSTSLGSFYDIVRNPKYFTKDKFFTKELDKKSSIILFYLSVFNVNLNNVGIINPMNGKPVTLDDIFECINLDDPDICHKTWKIFNDNQPNEYLGKDMFNLEEKYNMQVFTMPNNMRIKRLIKKK